VENSEARSLVVGILLVDGWRRLMNLEAEFLAGGTCGLGHVDGKARLDSFGFLFRWNSERTNKDGSGACRCTVG
jgi:hypothetical protein